MLVPAGIGSVPLLCCVERESQQQYRLVVFNCDPNCGLSYHSSTASNIDNRPSSDDTRGAMHSLTVRYQTALVVRDIAADRLKDDAFWAFFFKMAAVPSKHNTPDKFYDLLLSFLSDRPIEQVRKLYHFPPVLDQVSVYSVSDRSASLLLYM
jgi:hypothetical protein